MAFGARRNITLNVIYASEVQNVVLPSPSPIGICEYYNDVSCKLNMVSRDIDDWN